MLEQKNTTTNSDESPKADSVRLSAGLGNTPGDFNLSWIAFFKWTSRENEWIGLPEEIKHLLEDTDIFHPVAAACGNLSGDVKYRVSITIQRVA
jgi:hypothetical protein